MPTWGSPTVGNRRTDTIAGMSDWSPYITKTNGMAPRDTYVDAVERFDAPGDAIDLGYGAGNEVMDLLGRGWRVHAIDADPAAEAALRNRAADDAALRISTMGLNDAPLSPADLIHAGSSLFFTDADRFGTLWGDIVDALNPGGRFVGNLLGPRDSWAGSSTVFSLTREEVESLLTGLEVESLREQDEAGRSMQGPKHWHAFHIIARKPA